MKTEMPRWLYSHTESLAGKRIAVTGSTGGLGKELCRYLAFLGADLYLLDRNYVRSEAHKKALLARYPGCKIECIALDLEDLRSADKAVDRLIEENVDVFFHNAGAYKIPRHQCPSGYDNIFQINFATPYYMISKLLPHLAKRKGKVVAVGSVAHTYSHIDPEDVDFGTRRACSKVYGNAKRYLMFALHELFKTQREVSLSIVHPGITFTNITDHYPKPIFMIIKHPMKVIFMRPRKAALSLLQGVFDQTTDCEWIGPPIFDVWGYPKKRQLTTCDASERAKIAKIALTVLERCNQTLENKK